MISSFLYIFCLSLLASSQASNSKLLLKRAQVPTANTENVVRSRRGIESVTIPDYVKQTTFPANLKDMHQAFIRDTSSAFHLFFRNCEGTVSTKFSYWTSDDSGKSWTDQSGKFGENVIISLMQGSDIDKDRMVFLESSETKRDKRAIFVSSDGMETFQEIVLPTGVTASSITFHQTNSDWFLLQDFAKLSLWVSRDFGQTLTKLSDNVSPQQVYWGEEEYEKISESDDIYGTKNWERVVHFERFTTNNFLRNYEIVSCLIPECSSAGERYDELQKYSSQNDMAEGSFRSENGFIFFESRMNFISLLHVSYKRDDFERTVFPAEVAHEDFHIIATNQNFVLLAVKHTGGICNVYVSDERGVQFRESLRDVKFFDKTATGCMNVGIQPNVFNADIHEVKGLRGVFLANHYFEDRYKTVISRNGGKSWSVLSKPLREENGEWVEMSLDKETDSLNIHLEDAYLSTGVYVPTVISKKEIPGFVLAMGSVGPQLSDQSNLFVTNDAGRTWKRPNFREKYENTRSLHVFLDYGSILAIIPEHSAELYYTVNDGETWETLVMSAEPITSDAFWTEGDGAEEFVVFAHNSDHQWVTIAINVTALYGYCEENDYEKWEFANCEDKNNIGAEISYWRKKPTSSCFNPESFEAAAKKKSTETPCESCSMTDYFCQNNLKVVEDRRCSYLKSYNGYLRKSSLLPIKAPGNLCRTPFSWAAGNDDCKKAKIEFGGKTYLEGPLDLSAELVDSCGKPPYHWTLFSEDEQKVIATVDKDKFFYKDLPYGKYTLHVSDEFSKNTESFTVLQKISKAYLYCPEYTRIGFINELNVHVSDENGHWLDFYGLDQISGPVTFRWEGVPSGFYPTSNPFINVTFDNHYSADVNIDVQVSVESTLGTATSECRMKAASNLQMIQVSFEGSLDAPMHDQDYEMVKEYIKTALVNMYEDDEHEKFAEKYQFNFESDLEILPISHSLSEKLSLMYIYARLPEDFNGDIDEFREDLIKGLIRAHNDDLGFLIMNSIYIAKDDGTFEPYENSRRAGVFSTSVIFILLVIALIFAGKRYILPRIKFFVRPQHVPINAEDNDEEPIVEHDEIANVFSTEQ